MRFGDFEWKARLENNNKEWLVGPGSCFIHTLGSGKGRLVGYHSAWNKLSDEGGCGSRRLPCNRVPL